MNWVTRFYFALRGNGWFQPNAAGALLPFPFAWQAWLMTLGLVLLLLATIWLPNAVAWAARIALATLYILVGMLTYEQPDRPPQ